MLASNKLTNLRKIKYNVMSNGKHIFLWFIIYIYYDRMIND